MLSVERLKVIECFVKTIENDHFRTDTSLKVAERNEPRTHAFI